MNLCVEEIGPRLDLHRKKISDYKSYFGSTSVMKANKETNV